MMRQVFCALALVSAASAQTDYTGFVPSLYMHEATGSTECNTTTPYTVSPNTCAWVNRTSFIITPTMPMSDCEDDGGDAVVWFLTYYAGSTDCTGTSETTALSADTCYVYTNFSVQFDQVTGDKVKACQLAGIVTSMVDAEYISTEHNSSDCTGGVESLERSSLIAPVTTPVADTSADCGSLCDGYCCHTVDSSCNPVMYYKKLMTCHKNSGVYAYVTYSDSACTVESYSEVVVLGQCSANLTGDYPTSQFSTIEPAKLIGGVCGYSPYGTLFNMGATMMGFVTTDDFAAEVTDGETTLNEVISSAPALVSSLVAVAIALFATVM